MIQNYGQQDLSKININQFRFLKTEEIVTNGEFCKKLEKKISKICGSKYSLVCNNGTSALLMSILSLKKKNLVVILPNINFVAAPNIISLLKGKIVLCDVNEETGMVDDEKFKNCIKICKKRKIKPNIFIPVHYAGNILELQNISKICRKNKIDIIEDGCHSFGSKKKIAQKKFSVGNCKFSKLTTFSFHPVKNITTLEGGAISTNSKKLYERLKLLRSHSLKKTYINDPYTMVSPTLNFRMPEINAIVGIDQIKKINIFRQKRNKIILLYKKQLAHLENFFSILNFNDKNLFWHIFVIKLKNPKIKRRLMNFLKSNKIGCQIHYKPIFMHSAFKKNIISNDNKSSINFYNSQLTLPLFTKMSNNEVKKIVKKIELFFDKYQ